MVFHVITSAKRRKLCFPLCQGCFSVCLLETKRNNAYTDFHGILRTGAAWNKGHSGTFGDRLFYAWINCFTFLRQARRKYALSKCFLFTLCLGYTPIMYLFWKRYIPTCWSIRYPICPRKWDASKIHLCILVNVVKFNRNEYLNRLIRTWGHSGRSRSQSNEYSNC